ncbi:phage tail protein [Methylobacter tundripaludum]|uniref:phage tail protein n=1 Tax=Methylobacter tundripaludum TaxID=173365 RepID=UPI000689F257|nr:tail fiber protein [Methylobacter tundripaludum]
MDAFMGTVLAVGFNYPPRGWLFCNGQTVPVQQNSAMFALLGTMYGGDGQNTFGIPDLRGRVVVGSQAQGPGLPNVVQGEKAGANNTTVISNGTATIKLTTANLPSHTHAATFTGTGGGSAVQVQASTNPLGSTGTPSNGSYIAAQKTVGGQPLFAPGTPVPTATVNLGGVSGGGITGGTVSNANTGDGTPLTVPVVSTASISNMQPYLGLNYIIAMEGIFPSRN